jgi:hypothetical protein
MLIKSAVAVGSIDARLKCLIRAVLEREAAERAAREAAEHEDEAGDPDDDDHHKKKKRHKDKGKGKK